MDCPTPEGRVLLPQSADFGAKINVRVVPSGNHFAKKKI